MSVEEEHPFCGHLMTEYDLTLSLLGRIRRLLVLLTAFWRINLPLEGVNNTVSSIGTKVSSSESVDVKEFSVGWSLEAGIASSLGRRRLALTEGVLDCKLSSVISGFKDFPYLTCHSIEKFT